MNINQFFIKPVMLCEASRIYQASTSELYGLVQQMCAEMVANDLEETPKHALLKTHGYQLSVSVE
jgi:GDP-D-mannose dehydratase